MVGSGEAETCQADITGAAMIRMGFVWVFAGPKGCADLNHYNRVLAKINVQACGDFQGIFLLLTEAPKVLRGCSFSSSFCSKVKL